MESQSNNNPIESQEILKNMLALTSDDIKKAAEKKAKEIIEDSKSIVLDYLSYYENNELTLLEINLIKKVALFSIKEIEKSFTSTSGLENVLESNQNMFLQNIASFWKETISYIQAWNN
jgi:hypothetical protein